MDLQAWQRFCERQRRDISTGEKLSADHPRTNPELEHRNGNGALAAGKSQEAPAGRIFVRIVSVRKRLCDPDNLCEKWAIDCLRYCGCIPGDEPEKITLETSQRKAAKGEDEKTEVEVIYP